MSGWQTGYIRNVEHRQQSQQNVIPDHHGQLVTQGKGKELNVNWEESKGTCLVPTKFPNCLPGNCQKREWPSRCVDETEVVDCEATNITDLIENMGSIMAVKLQVI